MKIKISKKQWDLMNKKANDSISTSTSIFTNLRKAGFKDAVFADPCDEEINDGSIYTNIRGEVAILSRKNEITTINGIPAEQWLKQWLG